MNLFIRPWRNLFNFNGRATRTEYAMFHIAPILALVLLSFALAAFDFGAGDPPPAGEAAGVGGSILGLTLLALYVLFLIGHISISVRRLHDHGDSGFKYLLTFIPLIGLIFWAILVFTRGDDFENDYGPDPRNPESDAIDDLGQVFS